MKAKEMFEKLGYEYIKEEDCITYKEKTNTIVQYTFAFCKQEKVIEAIPEIRGKHHHFTSIDMKLLKAINKQVKELGWK